MSGNLGVWQVDLPTGPTRLAATPVDLEKQLEGWIEQDPALLEAGLTIVGRQLHLATGYLDLLALDPQGRWILIEIKRGQVNRDTVAQAIDYASCLDAMPFAEIRAKCDAYLSTKGDGRTLAEALKRCGTSAADQEEAREIIVYLVGVGRDPNLERIVNYLGRTSGLVIRAVTFQVFAGPTESRIMVRDLHESDQPPAGGGPGSSAVSVDDTLERARREGSGDIVELLHAAAVRGGLVPRPYRTSIRYAPPTNLTRCIYTVWIEPVARDPVAVTAWFDATNFEQFLQVPEDRLRDEIGKPNDYQPVTLADAQRLAGAVGRLLDKNAGAGPA